MSTSIPLAEAFRLGSQAQHREAESNSYIQAMIDGKITPASYAAYLQALWFVYGAMEAAITPESSLLSTLYDPSLFRQKSLESDFYYYTRQSLDDTHCPSAATKRYVNQINQLAQNWPLGLVAHHYTRYMGDLAGGQMLKGCVEKALRPESGQGLAAFEFPQIPNPAAYRQEYRAKLNSLPVSPEEQERLVEEVREVFRLNTALFIELGSRS